MRTISLDRAAKLFVLIWVGAAVAAEALGMAPGWRPLVWWSAGAFLVSGALALLSRRAMSLVLLFAYVCPVLIYLLSGQRQVQFNVLWMAAFLGALLPDGLRTSWHVPRPWRAPLVCWALVAIVSATIVTFREFDFTWALLHVRDVSNSSIGGWPSFVATWSIHVALVLLLGILWFDWMAGLAPDEFRSVVVVPLIASLAASIGISVAQLFFDIRFLNPTVYGNIGRATGGAMDANVAGMIASLWIGGVVLSGDRLVKRRSWLIPLGVAGAWLAVWASGSRTALAAAVVITAAAVLGLAIGWRRHRGAVRLWPMLAGAAAVLVLLVIAANAASNVVGPVSRIRDTLPSMSSESIRAFGLEMWNRNDYGRAATRAIDDHPFFGIGVGSFHVMLPDFARLAGSELRAPDNAQNWARHQLAEFGLVGSLAWIAWLVMFGAFVIRHPASSVTATWVGRAVLIAFALVSLVGMPAQDLMVALTFWTMAFWYVRLAEPTGPARSAEAQPLSASAWLAIALVVAAFGAGTVVKATGSLRVPARAQRIGWPYSYGFYPPEHDAAGEFRWTGEHAVAVVEAPSRALELSVSANHANLQEQPVHARVWCDGALVIDARLRDGTPVVRQVQLADSEARVLIEARVDHTVRPSDFGAPDERDLGVMMRWRFDGDGAQAAEPTAGPAVTASGDAFAIDGDDRFLYFVSMFDALRERARPNGDALLRSDFDYIRNTLHADGVRILPNWWACGDGCDPERLLDPRPGSPAQDGLFDARKDAPVRVRASALADLKSLLTAASDRGLIVDVTFTRETMNVAAAGEPPARGEMPLDSYQAAIVEVAAVLRPYRNVIFDLQNEFPLHGLDEADIAAIAAAVHEVDAARLVTASVSASSRAPSEAGSLAGGLDAVSYHGARVGEWFTPETYASSVEALRAGMREAVRPIYFQEPAAFGPRPGDDEVGAHFATAARAARDAGAAAWTFHQRVGFVLTTQTFRERLADPRVAALKAAMEQFAPM